MTKTAGGWPTEAVVDLGALQANYAEAAKRAGARAVIAVVKADAYGHGAVAVARALLAVGCPRLATLNVDEAATLRDAGVAAPILVLAGALGEAEAELAVARQLTPVVHDAAGLELLAAAARRGTSPLAVHVEIDTGMRRMGVAPEQAVSLLAAVASESALSLEGTFTHLARADERDLEPTRAQLSAFAGLLAAARAQGLDPGDVHVANSAGLLADPELVSLNLAQQAVRPGLMLYGAQPSAVRRAELRPVMSLRTRVVAVREARQGDAVGYSARYRAPRDTQIATLPVGYADGVPIAATGRGEVWLAGRRRPIAGRVSMDYVTVDVGDASVHRGDPAVLFGAELDGGPAVLPVDDAAAAAETLAYELLVRVGARARRVYVESRARSE